MKTKQEIEAQIKEIKKERATLPEHSMFGDPNWKMMDGQVAILEKAKNGKLQDFDCKDKIDSIYDTFDNPDEGLEDPIAKSKIDAYDWLQGNIDEI